ncbi:MAG: serine/threonine-protein kinase [Gemmatimonadaceae bacterium]
MLDDAGLRDRLQTTLGHDYRLGAELGGGGMSRVFVADDARLGRRVVVKVLPPDLAAEVSAGRFEREVRFAARLQHPHIVPLFTAGEIGPLLYYTMPFVEGESLRQRLAREGALPVPDAVRLIRELADALDYAHRQGVVHRDLKPENVLLSGGHATIADFGIAKALSSASATAGQITATNTVIGTPLYMAPEQASGDPATDHRADLYALGLIAYELFTGVHPFAGRAPHAMVAAHFTETPPLLTDTRHDLSPALSGIVARLLAKRPEDRPQSASEIVRVIDETTSTGDRARPLLAWSFPSSRRRLVMTIAMMVLVVSAGIATWRLRASPIIEPPSLMVLPFENLGPAADQYFADGLTDEVTSRLSGVSGLRLIGRASARQYKGTTKSPREIGREVGATHLLTGTVRWERDSGTGGRVRVSSELVRVVDQSSVWSEPYEAPLSDVFRVQASVAERVAAALDVALLAREQRVVRARPTSNVAAYDAYLRARAQSTPGTRYQAPPQLAAIVEFERAVALDPSFAAAHARLADSYLALFDLLGDPAMLAKARASSDRAWSLDSTLEDSRLARARYLTLADDPEGAYRAVSAAAAAAPTNAEVLFRLAETEEALGWAERALNTAIRAAALDPKTDPAQPLGGMYAAVYRYEESIRALEHEIAIAPQTTGAYGVESFTYLLWRADTSGARHVLERGGPPLMAISVCLPDGSAIWQHVMPPAMVLAKDTLTLQGYVAEAGGFPPELFYLMKVRHFAFSRRLDRALIYADSLVALVEPLLRHAPDVLYVGGDYTRRASLAEAYAYLGRTADAARELDRYVADSRRVRNKTVALEALVNAAYIDVVIGRRDIAIARLEEALSHATGKYISRPLLRADPSWASLRGEPRFERLIGGA